MNDAKKPIRISGLIILATLIVLNPIRADDTNGTPLSKIAATAADKHYGERMIVTGLVAQVTVRPNVVYLNFDKPFPDSPFSGIIFHRFTSNFVDVPSLKGKDVEVEGTITNFRGKSEILLSNASQLTISAPQPGTGGQTPGLGQ